MILAIGEPHDQPDLLLMDEPAEGLAPLVREVGKAIGS
jgi:ABC-type branched-subunit amino acid transport system ATPase component